MHLSNSRLCRQLHLSLRINGLSWAIASVPLSQERRVSRTSSPQLHRFTLEIIATQINDWRPRFDVPGPHRTERVTQNAQGMRS